MAAESARPLATVVQLEKVGMQGWVKTVHLKGMRRASPVGKTESRKHAAVLKLRQEEKNQQQAGQHVAKAAVNPEVLHNVVQQRKL